MLYSLDDIVITPSVFSNIEHRSECVPYDEHGKLPLFAAPMSCVIDADNFRKFEEVGINTILPRNIDLGVRLNQCVETFVALGLEEFNEYVVEMTPFTVPHYICVDIANGHMVKLFKLSKKAKEVHGDNLVLMIGNIANPGTFFHYADIGVDYVRLGIGSGNVCTTSANTGIHYPLASLISDIYNEILTRQAHDDSYIVKTKLIADGGFKNFDQINKALALGADYVMLGQVLAKSEEACGKTKFGDLDDNGIFIEFSKDLGIGGCNCREYYGMSTKRAQKEFGKKGNTTAEGIIKWVRVEYPIAKWVDNFKHYLRSAMSYTNSKNLREFKLSKCQTITPTGRMSFYK